MYTNVTTFFFFRFEEIADNKAFIEDWYSTGNLNPGP